VTRTHELRIRKLPSGLGCYPAVLFRRRPEVTAVDDPPEVRCTVERVVVDAAEVARYSTVCGFESGVPVTYPHVLAMPLHLRIFATRWFPLRPMGLIHLSNVIETLVELQPGMPLAIEVAARHYQRTDAGLAFDMATEITCEGRPAWRETCVFMSRWPASAERTGGRPPRPPRAPKDSAVLAELEVTSATAWSYARVSRDFNPIHLNDRAARFFGLRGAIGHGMWSLARSLAQAPPPAIAGGARIETQFLTPVQLPGRVAVKEWTEAGQVRRALCDVRTGRVHMYAWWSSPSGITPVA
jgi:acyl dehydratase